MKNLLILRGGLGNQMFQYALLLSLRNRGFYVDVDISYYDFVKMHNGYELNRIFGIKEKTTSKQGLHITWLRFLNRYKPKYLCKFDKLYYDESVLISPKHYLFGYWQDERYFNKIEDKIRSVFTFKDIDDENNIIAQEIRQNNSVSLHVRRGDYAAFGMTILGKEYYCNAVEYIKSKVENPVFYIFSDDEAVAKTIAERCGKKSCIVNRNKGSDSYKDMYLMSQCKHNIIANSSFSWWGAWLNVHKDKIVIAPAEWDKKKSFFKPQCENWILL